MSRPASEAEARKAIERMIASELGLDITPAARALVDELLRRYGGRIAAVLFYGSCLRTGDAGGMHDFYVIVDRYKDFYGGWALAAANALLPPNVFCVTARSGGLPVVAKVAVMSCVQFARAMHRGSLQTSVWARFCQPAALVYARDPRTAAAIRQALVEAVVTAAFWAVRLGAGPMSERELWTSLFRATYGAELRAERSDRPDAIYGANAKRYDSLTRVALIAAGVQSSSDLQDGNRFAALSAQERRAARRAWQLRRLLGKALSVLRLSKAAFTFEGAVDYICWKIERHSGIAPQLTDWQRRHPILAGPAVAWRLYRQGAFH